MKLQNNTNVVLVSYSSVNKEDIREIYLEWLNNIDVVNSFGTFSMLLPKEKSIIEESFKRFTQDDSFGFFIYDKESKSFVGTCKLDKISLADRSLEIGIMIGDVSSHGKGIGKQTYSLLLNYAFNTLGMNRVWGTCFSDNIGSRRLFESMNFKLEGTAREAVYRKGKYLDNLMYSILINEFNNSR